MPKCSVQEYFWCTIKYDKKRRTFYSRSWDEYCCNGGWASTCFLFLMLWSDEETFYWKYGRAQPHSSWWVMFSVVTNLFFVGELIQFSESVIWTRRHCKYLPEEKFFKVPMKLIFLTWKNVAFYVNFWNVPNWMMLKREKFNFLTFKVTETLENSGPETGNKCMSHMTCRFNCSSDLFDSLSLPCLARSWQNFIIIYNYCLNNLSNLGHQLHNNSFLSLFYIYLL